MARCEPPFQRLREVFGLSSTEPDILLIALAPEVGPRYERIFAYLQNDSRRLHHNPFIINILRRYAG